MKQFNSLLFAVLMCFWGLSTLNAQVCTPDVSLGDVPGLYPDTLANGQIGVAYNQVINVVIPEDTALNVSGLVIPISICTFKIDSIPNLPAGMTFECDDDDCIYDINHADTLISRACVVISGTPESTVAPDDSLVVYVSVDAGTVNDDSICEPLTIAIPPELTTIVYKAQLKIIDPNATSIDEEFGKELNLSLYPNPASGTSRIAYSLDRSSTIRIEILDLMGRVSQTVFEGRQAAGAFNKELNVASLSAGWYMVRITRDDQAQVSKSLWVQN